MFSERKSVLALPVICLLGITLCAATPEYHLLKRVEVGGVGVWDYLTYDASYHRVFVSRGTHVMVLDGESGATVGDIPDTLGVHGIALAPDLGKGFTSNGRTNTVTIFDLKTLKHIGQTPTGQVPDAIIYDPASKRVFTFNGWSDDSTAIDAQSGQPTGTIPLKGRPEFAVADGKGLVFVNIADKNTLTVIDSQQLTIKANWDMPGCKGPTGLSMDRENRRLFAVCQNKVMTIVDAESGKVITTVPIGAGADATVFSPKRSLVFSSNGGDGTLTVVHEDSPNKFTVAQSVATEDGARTMALDEDSGTVYLITAKVGPKLILSFILEILYPVVRPAAGWLAGFSVLISMIFLVRARNRGWPRKLLWWWGAFFVVGLIFAGWYWNYDALLLKLSPQDFHMSMWTGS
jgi:DNA-binding beta-propeller fold protein YncE